MGTRDYNFVPGNALELSWEELNTLYSDEDGSNPCYLVALDQRKISLILSHINRFPKYHWTWGLSSPRSSWTPEQRAQWEEIEAFVSETEFCLMSGCDLSDFNANVERIAVALESIDEKAVERITWDEMMQDLSDTLGVTNALYRALLWVGDLFPRIRVKMDMAPLAMSLWDYFRWKAPILALLSGANASLATIAAAQIAEKPLILLQTILQGFNSLLNVNNRIYDFIVGDWNWYDNVLKPLWDSFISDGEGGTGGENPDADPENRVITRVYNDVFVEGDAITCAPDVTVNCGGGGGCCGQGDTSQDITEFNGISPVTQPDPEGDPPEGFDTWELFFTYKCQAANWYIDKYIATLRNWALFEGFVGMISATLVLGATLILLPPVGVAAILSAIGLIAVFDTGLFIVFAQIAGELESQKEDIVCQLYNAEDTTEAISAIENATSDIIDGLTIPEGIVQSFKNACAYLLSHDSAKVLFEKDDTLDGYEGSVGCGGCAECEALKVVWGTLLEGNTWQAEYYQNHYWIGLSFNALPGEGIWTQKCGLNVQVTLSNPAGITKFSNTPIFRLSSGETVPEQGCTGWDVYCGDTLPTGSNCLTHLAIASATNFTIDISIGADCQES